jgi:hypothetical protein
MLRSVFFGTLAGAAGTIALHATTYGDMVVRGRPASDTPSRVVDKIASGVGADLSGQPETLGPHAEQAEQAGQNRASGLGALMGFANGLGVGSIYGLMRAVVGQVPLPLAAVLLGAAAMASSDVPAARLQVTDPSEWGTSGWLADIIPHLAYGLVTALVYESLLSNQRR